MGNLYLLGLPIGNLEDITLRGRKALEDGKVFAVEDTRSFMNLLHLLGINVEGKNIFSLHDQSGDHVLEKSIQILKGGEDLLMASEAGSPIISDPAYPLVKKVIEEGIEVISIPGVTSVITALELSGLPPHPFSFMGFFPRENSQQSKLIQKLKGEEQTLIFFESPHRIVKTITLLSQEFPKADFAVVRELTKKFETAYRFKGEKFKDVKENLKIKGEFVLLFSQKDHLLKTGNFKRDLFNDETVKLAQEMLEKGASTKKLSKLFSIILEQNTKEIYNKLSSKS